MFWIMGGDFLLRSICLIYDTPFTRVLEKQMEHVPYEGFHFYDLVFPLFLFIAGISVSLALPSLIENKGKAIAIRHIVIRSVVLFLLGIFYMGGISNGSDNVYFAGVLQRISTAYLFSALIFCYFGSRPIIIITFLLLIGYYAILALIPVPGFGEPSFEQGKNLAHFIDQWLPGQKFEGTILGTMGAVANVLIGVIIGKYIKNKIHSEQKKVIYLIKGGFILLFCGYLWGNWFPVIKLLWTSSYVLVSCGYAMILMAFFYQTIEVWKYRRWAKPFVWIGMNSLGIYVACSLINFRKLSQRFIGGEVKEWLGSYHELLTSLITLFFVFWLAEYLYRKKIYIKI